MNEVAQILEAIESGDTAAAERLLPIAYDELHQMAVHKMTNERAGHTLQPTALVHEAYLKLLGPEGEQRQWNSSGHFFSAAAEAMRRILIENARKKRRIKRGCELERTTWDESKVVEIGPPAEEMIAVNEALKDLEVEDPALAQVVKLRYFAGMTVPETASALGVSPRTVNRQWECARAWLYCQITDSPNSADSLA